MGLSATNSPCFNYTPIDGVVFFFELHTFRLNPYARGPNPMTHIRVINMMPTGNICKTYSLFGGRLNLKLTENRKTKWFSRSFFVDIRVIFTLKLIGSDFNYLMQFFYTCSKCSFCTYSADVLVLARFFFHSYMTRHDFLWASPALYYAPMSKYRTCLRIKYKVIRLFYWNRMKFRK